MKSPCQNSPVSALCHRGTCSAAVLRMMRAGFMLLLVPSFSAAMDIPLSGIIPPSVQEIELSYLGEQTIPTVTLHGPSIAIATLPYRPFVPILNLLPLLRVPQVFGSCRGLMTQEKEPASADLRFSEGTGALCGQRLALQPADGLLDGLSYGSLHLRGQATGSIRLALEDQARSRLEDNVPVATVTGAFDLTIPLPQIGRQLDLRKLTALVVTTQEAQAGLRLEELTLRQERPAATRAPHVGLWVWSYRAAVTDPAPVFATCKRQGCTRLLIQMPSLSDDAALWQAYAEFFSKAQEAGIEAVALDGYPAAIYEPQKLVETVQRLLRLVEPRALAGVQFDIEPYLLPGFQDDESGSRRYLNTIDVLHEAIGGRTRLSMVIPFWLTSLTLAGRPLAYAVMDRVDEIAVMSYRTNLDELLAISDDTLRYGDLIGTSVWLAVETTALPVERRVILKRDPRPELADAVLDHDRQQLRLAPMAAGPDEGHRREWFRVHHRVTVRPERITFAGRSRSEVSSAVNRLLESVPHRSFAGILIHDLDGIRALPE